MHHGCSTREGSSNQTPLCPSAPRASPAQRAHQSRAQRLSHAIAGDAAADGEYLGSKCEDFLAYVLRDELFAETLP